MLFTSKSTASLSLSDFAERHKLKHFLTLAGRSSLVDDEFAIIPVDVHYLEMLTQCLLFADTPLCIIYCVLKRKSTEIYEESWI